MKGSIKVGRIYGIDFELHISWFFIFTLLFISMGVFFRESLKGYSPVLTWSLGFITTILFFLSLLAHEFAHSFVSVRNGVPVKSITLFIFGGVARIIKEVPSPGVELKMASAGPLCSLSLAAFFGGLWFVSKDHFEPFSLMAGYLGFINLLLALFNLLPGFPLDGGRLLRSILWMRMGSYERSTYIAHNFGKALAIVMGMGGLFVFVYLKLWITGVWLLLVGGFLYLAASQSYRQAKLRVLLSKFTAESLMVRDCPQISPYTSLLEFIEVHLPLFGRKYFLVVEDDVLKGVLSPKDIKDISLDKLSYLKVGDVMAKKLLRVNPWDRGIDVLERLEETGASYGIVVYGGRVIGVIGREEILR